MNLNISNTLLGIPEPADVPKRRQHPEHPPSAKVRAARRQSKRSRAHNRKSWPNSRKRKP